MDRKTLLLMILIGGFAWTSEASQNVWQGTATVSRYGDFPSGGYYAASNAFPPNTLVEVTNLENSATITVIVTQPLKEEGLLLLLSGDAARALGIPSGTIARVRAVEKSRVTAGAAAGGAGITSDIDFNPGATIPESALTPTPTPTPVTPLPTPRLQPGSVPLTASLLEPSPPPGPTPQPARAEPTPVPSPSLTPSPSPTPAPARAEPTPVPTPSPAPTPAPARTEPTPIPTVPLLTPTAPPTEPLLTQLTSRTPSKPLRLPPRSENPFLFLTEPETTLDLSEAEIELLEEPELPESGGEIAAATPQPTPTPEVAAPPTPTPTPEPAPSPLISLTPPRTLTPTPTPIPLDDPPPVPSPQLAPEPPHAPSLALAPPLLEPAAPARDEALVETLTPPTIPDTALVVPQEEPTLAEAPPTPGPTPTPILPEGEVELALVPAEERPPVAPEPTPTPEAEAIERIIEQLPPAPTPTPSPTPAPVVADTNLPLVESLDPGAYYLQIGAFTRPQTALHLVQRIRTTYPVVAYPLTRPDGTTVYRILVGPLNEDEGGTLLYWFKAQGFRDAFIQRGR